MAEQTALDPSLRGRLEEALELAQSSDRDSVESATLRLILCAIDDRDVSARERGECRGCAEGTMQDLLLTMARQRQQSACEYDEAGRIEEAERERAELEVIQTFLPKTLKDEALRFAAEETVEELEAAKLKDIGRCMKALKAKYPGRIDTGLASKVFCEILGA